MATKKTVRKTETPDWKSRIKESSHDLFLAGLAALSRARSSKKKSDKASFETLVAEGRKLEPEVTDSLQKKWSALSEKSRSSFSFKSDGKLQDVLEERVVAALSRVGVPTRKEIDALSAKVDRLLAKKGTKGAKTSSRRSTPAKKAVARKSPTRAASKSK